MTAPTLAAFLRARWDEEEAVARAAALPGNYTHYADNAAEECIEMAHGEGCSERGVDHWRRHDPARVLADLASKRKIAELHEHVYRQGDGRLVGDEWACRTCPNEWHWCPTIRLLAEPYASHPEFRPEWVA